MAVLGKLNTVSYTCYELGHTWTPSCTVASLDVMKIVSKQALKIYGTLYLVAGILKRRDLDYFKKKLLLEIGQSTLFLSTNGTLFITFFCLWRKLLGRFFFLTSSFIPAAMGSYVAILLERKSRRGLLAIYMANVATETAYRMLLSRNLIKPIWNGEVLLFSIASAIYLYFYKKNSLPIQTTRAFSYLIGTEELPPAVREEEVQRNSSKRRRKNYLSQLGQVTPIKQITKCLQNTPKHACCQHQHGCLHYIIQSFTKMFGVGFVIQGGVKLLSALPRIVKNPAGIMHAVKHKDNIRLGAFLGCFSAIFKSVNCLLRWLRNKDDDLHGLVAGFLAGWSMLWYKSTTVALYTAYKLAEVLYFKGIAKGVVPYIKCADIIIYSLSTAFVFHVAVLEPHNLRPAYWNFLMKVTGNRFTVMNRKLIEPFVPNATKLFPNFWPDYDMRYTNLRKEMFFPKS